MSQELINIIALMLVAIFMVWIFRRISLPPILAYLVAGFLVGPQVIGLFQDSEQMHLLAEIGIVFLLFSLGLEFSLPRMLAMRHLVFGIGAAQVLASILVFTLLGLVFELTIVQSLIIASMLTLSSTAIVIKQISDMGRLHSPRSQVAVSILLFQDLAVVPLLIIIPLLNNHQDQSLLISIALAIGKGILVVTLLLAIGRWVLPRVFNEIARTRTDELFVLTTIAVALLAALVTYAFGLSMALGAFLAGMMLSESQFRHQLEADIRPFRDILMGLFFITIGMQFNIFVLLHAWYWILLGLIALVVIKALVIRLVAGVMGISSQDAWGAGIKLAQIGEFSFVLLALALENQLLDSDTSGIIISIGILSMALTPMLINRSGQLSLLFSPRSRPDTDTLKAQQSLPQDISDHVVIIGFGRVGQSVAKMLKLEGLKYLAIDFDPVRVQESLQAGEPIIFGDAAAKDILKSALIENAQMALITFDQHSKALAVVDAIKSLTHTLPLLVRTRKDYHAEDFYVAGVDQVVPELQEGSLMLVSQVLHYAGVPMSRILKRVRNERKRGYQHMHGFYPGETTELSYETKDKLEFMHAVVIGHDAYAVGKSLSQLDITRRRVTVHALRRNSIETETPASDTIILANDVLIIAGKPRRVERIEKFLLYGN